MSIKRIVVIVLFGVETNVRRLKARDNETKKVFDTRTVSQRVVVTVLGSD